MWFFKKKKKDQPVQEEVLEQTEEMPTGDELVDGEQIEEAADIMQEEDLDDILKEFSNEEPSEDAVPEEGTVEKIAFDTVSLDLSELEVSVEATSDTVRIDMPESDAQAGEATSDTVRIDLPELEERSEAVTGDTIRLEIPEKLLQTEEVTGDTIRLDIPEDMLKTEEPGNVTGDTVRFSPVELPEQEAGTEPFSEGWEPEYEQPIGEYVPPQPIIFRPKSRLRELKRKLVNGPERRYYELSEQGLLRLQLAMLVTLVVALLSAGATVLYETGVLADQVKLVAFSQLFGMLIAALMGTYQLMDGVADVFKKRFSLNSLLVLSFLACIADGVFCLRGDVRVPCCAAFTIQMTMSLWNAYHLRVTELGQMDTMRKATRLDGLAEVEDYHDGCSGLLRTEGQVEDFMEHYQDRSKMDQIISIYALCACGVSLVGGIVMGIIYRSVEFGVQVFAVCLLASVPGTFFITMSRPRAILEKRLHKLGTVLCGWERIAKLCKRVVFPLDHEDLFPNGSCMLNGVKFYGTRDPDQVVAYATAVVAADGGGLTPLFEQLLASRNGRHYQVENLRLYGGGGIGAEVCGEPVLVGVLSFLKEMGVEIPEGTMVSQAVYVAVDGELSGVFALSTTKTKSAAAGLSTLCGYRSLRPMLVTGDFLLTEEFIRGKFGVNTRRMAFPDFATRAEVARKRPETDAPSLALVTQEGLAPLAYAVTGARSVQTAAIIGMSIHLLGGILGLIIVLVLSAMHAENLLTPVNMLLFQLIWMIPGLLVTEWTRSV